MAGIVQGVLASLGSSVTAGWNQLHNFVTLDDSSTSSGVSASFTLTTARYLRVRIYNSGIYGSTGYTELYNIKVFGSPAGTNFASTENGATIGNAVVNGADVSSIYFGPSAYSLSMSTAASWPAVGAIFTGGSNTNSTLRSSKASNNGSTFNGGGSAGSPFNIVIDLGQNRSISSAHYYQMFSDGKTTDAALDYATSLLPYTG